MTTPYYPDDAVALWHGDSLEVLSKLPPASVDCCVTSPPYFGLRDYGSEGQYGLEATPGDYVEQLRAVFAEVRRVLADDGTLWLNLGDTYAGKANGGESVGATRGHGRHVAIPKRINTTAAAPYKSLLGMPWRVALALVDDGWTLRNDVIWSKPNGMPESITDRLSTRHEHVFLLTKGPRYYFDLGPIREDRKYVKPPAVDGRYGAAISGGDDDPTGQRGSRYGGNPMSSFVTREYQTTGRNPGDVWTIPTAPFPEAHFAAMAPALATRCIAAGCKPDGTVLDPFSGSGTTGMVAARLGRRYVGIDISAEYLDLSLRTRLAQTALFDTTGETA